jgi:phosphate transport system substrate-binding protein
VEKWIEEFKKSNPTASIRILTRGAANADSANLIINAHELTSEEIRPGYSVVNLGRYVLLPVANIKNVPIQPYVEKGIKVKDLKRLFFDKFDPYASEEEIQAKSKKLNALASQINIYTRQQKACAPTTFAKNYGFEQVDIVGKQIAGDDKHLIQAVLKDTNGVTYNNLGFVYDRNTRKVVDHLKVVPIDLNNNGKLDENENFYGNLDVLISKLENEADKDIPVGYVNISFPKQIAAESNTAKFLNWVLENGQKFNHEYGFLNLQPDVLVQQKASLPTASR